MALDVILLALTVVKGGFAAHEGSRMDACKPREFMKWLGADVDSHMSVW